MELEVAGTCPLARLQLMAGPGRHGGHISRHSSAQKTGSALAPLVQQARCHRALDERVVIESDQGSAPSMRDAHKLAEPNRAPGRESSMDLVPEHLGDGASAEPLEQRLVFQVLCHAQGRLVVRQPGQPRLKRAAREPAGRHTPIRLKIINTQAGVAEFVNQREMLGNRSGETSPQDQHVPPGPGVIMRLRPLPGLRHLACQHLAAAIGMNGRIDTRPAPPSAVGYLWRRERRFQGAGGR